MSDEPQNPIAADQDDSRVEERSDVSNMGMAVFLASLTVLFVASLAAFFVVRLNSQAWPQEHYDLPFGMWLATFVILLSSAAIQLVLWGVRNQHDPLAKSMMALTMLFGVVFLLVQISNWKSLIESNLSPSANLFTYNLYFLTGLHAIHVIGGLILLAVVGRKLFAGLYTALYHPGVRHAAVYWHFLDVVWLVLFAVLFIFQ